MLFGWPFCSYQFPHVDAVMHSRTSEFPHCSAFPLFQILKLLSPEPHGSPTGTEEQPNDRIVFLLAHYQQVVHPTFYSCPQA